MRTLRCAGRGRTPPVRNHACDAGRPLIVDRSVVVLRPRYGDHFPVLPVVLAAAAVLIAVLGTRTPPPAPERSRPTARGTDYRLPSPDQPDYRERLMALQGDGRKPLADRRLAAN